MEPERQQSDTSAPLTRGEGEAVPAAHGEPAPPGDRAEAVEGGAAEEDGEGATGASPPPDPSPPEEEAEPVMAVLLCGGCKRPVASAREILPERHERAWREHVYCYELDLFENGSQVWTYSATNPSANRFDLIRVQPTVQRRGLPQVVSRPSAQSTPSSKDGAEEGEGREAMKRERSGREEGKSEGEDEEEQKSQVPAPQSVSLVTLRGPYSAEHSFFTGYSWCYCSCVNCGHFLGWGFLADDKVEAHNRAKKQQLQAKQAGGSSETQGAPVDTVQGSPTSSARQPSRAGQGGDDDSSTSSSEAEESSDASSSIGAVESNSPQPDFLGIIVTHCTGESEFPARAFAADVASAEGRRKRRAVIQELRQDLLRRLRRLQNGMIAHRLLMSFDAVAHAALTGPLMPLEDASAERDRGAETAARSAPVQQQQQQRRLSEGWRQRPSLPLPDFASLLLHTRDFEEVGGVVLPTSLRHLIAAAADCLHREAQQGLATQRQPASGLSHHEREEAPDLIPGGSDDSASADTEDEWEDETESDGQDR